MTPPSSGPNHYERLGVDADASPDAIRKAYRVRAKDAHPDAGGDPDTFRALRQAFDVLSNPLTRKEYDDSLHIRPGVRWDAATGTGKADRGWSGMEGDFTGDVSFPAYLRDITDAPWQAETRPTTDDEVEHLPAADVQWWWPQHATTRIVPAGAVVLVGNDEAVVAVDALGGRDAWRAGMPGRCTLPPVVVGDTVVAWTDDGTLHGLELARGVTRWERRIGPPSTAELLPLAGAVLVARADGVVGPVATADGSLGWGARLAGPPSSMATDGRHAVVVSEGTTVEAVELRKGRHRWRTRSRLPIDLPPVVLGDSAWLSSGRGTFHRVDLATGAERGQWSARTAVAGAVADDRTLYVTVAGPAQLVAIDPGLGVRWSVSTDVVAPEPALVDDLAVLAEPSGRVAVHRRTDGALVGAAQLAIEPHGPPVVVGDQVMVRERSGRLWSMRLPIA
ncbi:MAG: PQQ-binding-like beta-propeller repeat protein [Acidimicrobiales bacterium]|nr:PQQ-binding-like beta-propeller repeat protein [Acidobacteriota bacterium]MCB1247948.1 PQQ-binding-like beta-propeller repeat protein [Acidimicrobiales bacterium]MCB1259993.1 PQQ-binding-like beta-propeller repeat protein [Acidimicrobiales bacterium]